MRLTYAPQIHTFDNHSITTGFVVVNRVSILTTDTTDAEYIQACLQRWINEGQIKLRFNCTEQEAFILGLADPG